MLATVCHWGIHLKEKRKKINKKKFSSFTTQWKLQPVPQENLRLPSPVNIVSTFAEPANYIKLSPNVHWMSVTQGRAWTWGRWLSEALGTVKAFPQTEFMVYRVKFLSWKRELADS